MGFFRVTDNPAARVVQYQRVGGPGENVVYIEDESVLGETTDQVSDVAVKTGIAASVAGVNYSVNYLPDAGPVYIAKHPADGDAGKVLSVTPMAGKAPYTYQWFFNDQMVIDTTTDANKVTASKPGTYFVRVTDADGVTAMSTAATIK
ncbi:MAG: hypothetical protein [Bacteriophage sp.]|nr:MAG: hypothetical protein [Bacteriophage sp.]